MLYFELTVFIAQNLIPELYYVSNTQKMWYEKGQHKDQKIIIVFAIVYMR